MRKLWRACFSERVLISVYNSAIESVLTYHISLWQGLCTVLDINALGRVIKTAETIIAGVMRNWGGGEVPSESDYFLEAISHPGNVLYTLLPCGR